MIGVVAKRRARAGDDRAGASGDYEDEPLEERGGGGAAEDDLAEDDLAEDDLAEDEEEFEEERDEPADGSRRARRRSRALTAATAGRAGLDQIGDLTGREPEGVTFVQPEQDGWKVGIEVVEDRRVPSSGDVLALYEIQLDADGDLLSYRRTRRYKRGRGDE
ncbi:gas vesicle protein GvpO [Streptosporangium sandarakinum]|uniref:gas vesicle protein GvpO n=1 Tax=Streptosporangium sandarakinum TaxID=1260955 RepID=UPI003447FECD